MRSVTMGARSSPSATRASTRSSRDADCPCTPSTSISSRMIRPIGRSAVGEGNSPIWSIRPCGRSDEIAEAVGPAPPTASTATCAPPVARRTASPTASGGSSSRTGTAMGCAEPGGELECRR